MVTCIFGWNRSLHSVQLECACLNVFSCRERDAHTYPSLCSLYSSHSIWHQTFFPPIMVCRISKEHRGHFSFWKAQVRPA